MSAYGHHHKKHVLGIVLVVVSALAFSIAGILTKKISADPWTISCWRGLVGGALVISYIAWQGRKAPLRDTFRLGWREWLLATVGSLASLAFIFAFKLTFVANVVIIYATVPFAAAALAWLLLKENLKPRTAVTAVICVAGVAVMVGGGLGSMHLTGDAVALLMTLGNALYIVLIRVFRDGSVVLAGGLSALQLFAISWLVVDPMAVSAQDVPLLLLFGLSFAVAVVLWTEGTKRVSAAESGLLGLAETPFAIILAWLLLSELPPSTSIAGGAIILVAIFAHASHDLQSATMENRMTGP